MENVRKDAQPLLEPLRISNRLCTSSGKNNIVDPAFMAHVDLEGVSSKAQDKESLQGERGP